MMSDQEQSRAFNARIDAFVDAAFDAKQVIVVNELAAQIVEEAHVPEFPETDFVVCGLFRAVVQRAGDRCRGKIGDETPPNEEGEQLEFPEFDIGKYYRIKRGAKSCLVPLEQMTLDEQDRKWDQIDAFGDGAKAHAARGRRYTAALRAGLHSEAHQGL